MAKAMTKHEDITPEDRALIADLQERDLPPPPPKLIRLLQPNSMDLLEQIPDAKAGDFAVPHDGEHLLFRGATGVPFIPIGFAQAFVEWGQGRSGYVNSHPKKPRDAIWRDGRNSPDGKAGYVRESGNRIEDTLYCHMLILSGGAPFGGTFAFRSTARAAGGEFESKAERLKVDSEGLGGLVCGKWVMRSPSRSPATIAGTHPPWSSLASCAKQTGQTRRGAHRRQPPPGVPRRRGPDVDSGADRDRGADANSAPDHHFRPPLADEDCREDADRRRNPFLIT